MSEHSYESSDGNPRISLRAASSKATSPSPARLCPVLESRPFSGLFHISNGEHFWRYSDASGRLLRPIGSYRCQTYTKTDANGCESDVV